MFDLGWSELLIIGVLTVLIFGPKELPIVLRTVTRWLGKARSVAREFQRTMEEVARESELDEIRKTVRDSATEMKRAGDPTGSFEGLFDVKSADIKPAGPRPQPTVERQPPAAADDADGPKSIARDIDARPASDEGSTKGAA